MFGLGKNDDDQRMWNLTMFGTPLTDKEFERASPFFLVVAILIIIGVIIVSLI